MARRHPSIRQAIHPNGAATRGFTLTEVLVVAAIVAILAAIALPVYTEQVRKGRRSDAISALTAVQQAQERWRANNAGYADGLAALQITSSSSPKGYYSLSLSSVSAAGYTVTASAVSGKAQADDAQCAQMWVTLQGGNLSYGSTQPGCWAQ